MRVLFLESSPIWICGLPNGFKDMGVEVKVSGSLTRENIPELIASFCPDLVIMIGWTAENCQMKQEWIKKYVHESGIPLVYWATEDPLHTTRWSLPLIERVKPDFVFSISRTTVSLYEKLGIPSAYMDFGYHTNVNRPLPGCLRRDKSIAVVANAYPDVLKAIPAIYRLDSMRNIITPLLNRGMHIDFWGTEWERMQPFLNCFIPQEWIHGYLDYKDTYRVYSTAGITLGLQNDPHQVTQRTYEILGSGGFLLTSDTPEIRRLFKPGCDLAVSSSPEETLEVVNYYLEHPDECERIRTQGRLAVLNHSYKHRAEYMIHVLREYKLLN